MVTLLIAFAASLIASLPVSGPIGVILVARGVQGRVSSGLALAIGAALAESMYAALAYWGAASVAGAFGELVPGGRIARAILLVTVGAMLLLSRPQSPDSNRGGEHGDFGLGFLMAAVNPTFLVTWTAIAAVCRSTGQATGGIVGAGLFAAGVAAGAVAGGGVLLLVTRRYRESVRVERLVHVLRVCGGVLVALGLADAIWLLVRGPAATMPTL